MKILHYIPDLDRSSGGTAIYMQLLSKALAQKTELYIATHASDNIVEISCSNLHFISSSVFGKMKKDWNDLLDIVRPDIVHINCCWMPQCAAAQKWAQQKKYKIVLSPHGMLNPPIIAKNYWTRKLPALLLYQKAAIKKADWIHSTAELEMENLLKLGYNSKISVVPTGIDTDVIQVRSSWSVTRKLFFLARIHVQKGIELLLHSVARLKEQMRDYSVIVAGEGEAAYINQLKGMTEQLGISNLIHFLGGVYGKQKWEIFREADIFVLPTYGENFGIAIAESLASGTPVITTNGAPWQTLRTYQCGWWIETGSVDALTDCLQAALQTSEAEREAMGIRARKLIMDKYSVQTMGEAMMELYQKL